MKVAPKTARRTEPQTIPISEFKARCIEVLKQVHRTRRNLLVTLRGEPLVTVEPYRAPTQKRRFGRYRNQTRIVGDVVHFDWSGDWDDSR